MSQRIEFFYAGVNAYLASVARSAHGVGPSVAYTMVEPITVPREL